MSGSSRKNIVARQGGFEARMLDHLRDRFAQHLTSLYEPAVRLLIRDGVARAAAYRLISERDVCRFIELLVEYGSDVDAPGGEVAAALANPSVARGSTRLQRAIAQAWRNRQRLAKEQVRLNFTEQPAVLGAVLRGEALSFTWDGGIKLARARATVIGPHWQAGQMLEDGSGSIRPAAGLVGGAGAKLSLRLDECSGIDGYLRVSGRLGGLKLEGRCPARVGEHTVRLAFKPIPKGLQGVRGDVVWQLSGEGIDGPVALDNPVRLEWYALLGPPASFFEPAGVWVEALRFLYSQVGVGGLTTPAQVVARIARFCHGEHGLRYDTFHGAPAYGCSGTGGAFQLSAYLTAAKPVVNCYDQAGAVQTLSGSLGVATDWLYLRPYGFIHTTQLVGVGDCNNPFFSNNASSPTLGVNDRRRTAFANHAFASLGSAVLDACAGPHTATEDRNQYIDAAIDAATTLYGSYANFRPGSAADILQADGVSKVV